MSISEVVYSEVKFTRGAGNTSETILPSADTTYSEVKLPTSQPPAESPGPRQPTLPTGRWRATSERVSLLILSLLLAAAVIALCFTFYKNIQTQENIERLQNENNALVKNLTERRYETNSCNTKPPVCPEPPTVSGENCQACKTGWEKHKGKCYFFSNQRSDWTQSRERCKQLGGDLVVIDSEHEQKFLESRVRLKMTNAEDKFWIGLTDAAEEGKWSWVDGSSLEDRVSFWLTNEPDDWRGENREGEDCVRMGEKTDVEFLNCWVDKSCKVPQRSICETQIYNGHLTCVAVQLNLTSL